MTSNLNIKHNLKNQLIILILIGSLFANLFSFFPVKEVSAEDAIYSSASTYGSGSLPFSDNFSDNSINSFLWPTVSNSTTTLAEVNNRIEITPVGSTAGYASMVSRTVGFTNGLLEVEFAQILGGASGIGFNDQGMSIILDSNNVITLNKGGGTGIGGQIAVRTGGVLDSAVFSDGAGTQRYRISISGTTANFHRWNGVAWALVGSKTVSWNLSAVTIQLYAGYWGTGNSNTQKGVFDNVVTTGVTYGSNSATDGDGNVYSTGTFTGIFDADPGAATSNLTSAGGDDVYVRKLDSGGNFVWAKRLGGTGADQGHYISLDGSGNVEVIGSFSGTVDFDPGPSTQNLISGSTDVFFLELSQVYESTVATLAASAVTLDTATLNGEVTDTGGLDVTDRGFEYGLTTTYTDDVGEIGTFGTGAFTADIETLNCDTLYHFRAFATNSEGISYGADETFTTAVCPPNSSSGSRSRKDYSNFQGLQFPSNFVPPSNSGGDLSDTVNPKNNQPLIANTFEFLRNLGIGSSGEDVKMLQRFLNQNSFTVAQYGAGSAGQETTYFGIFTKQAVKVFQEAFYQTILTPLNLSSGTGYFGNSTRNFVNSL